MIVYEGACERMRTIALRFAETFAPECGTIAAHQHMIDRHGFVWYGKLGNPVSLRVATDVDHE